MPSTTPLILLFALGTLIGAWRTYRMLTSNRRAITTPGALYQWSDRRLSSWKYEPQASGAILAHTLAMVVLGAAALATASKPATFGVSLLASDRTMVALTWFGEGGSILLAGYLLGTLVGYPLASLEQSPAAYGVTGEGILYGRTLMPWRWFSHFSLDQPSRLLRLYSAFAPNLPSFVVKVPASLPQVELSDLLRAHLPGQPASASRAWYRTKHMLVPAIVLACLPIVAAGWLSTRLPRELGLFTIVLCGAAMMFVGGKLITLFGFGMVDIREKKGGG